MSDNQKRRHSRKIITAADMWDDKEKSRITARRRHQSKRKKRIDGWNRKRPNHKLYIKNVPAVTIAMKERDLKRTGYRTYVCPNCNGKGKLLVLHHTRSAKPPEREIKDCRVCEGQGQLWV